MRDLRSLGERVLDVMQPDASRIKHVVNHLYVLRERWDLAIPDMPTDLRRKARQAGCRSADIEPRSGFHSICEACRLHVLADHERWYLPAALSAVESALMSGHFGRLQTRQGPREIFIGASAVLVLTHPPDAEGILSLVTAYRDPPSGRSPSNEEFHAKAVRKLRDKTSLGSGDLP